MSAKSLRILAVVTVALAIVLSFGVFKYLCAVDKELRGELVTTKAGLVLPCELHVDGLDVFYAQSNDCGRLGVKNATSRVYEDGSVTLQPTYNPQEVGRNE